MNRAERRRQQKLAGKTDRALTPGQAVGSAPIRQEPVSSLGQRIERAVQHHRDGDLATAESLYVSILNADPNQPDVLRLLGVLANQTGDSRRAVELMSRSLTVQPDNADTYFNLGNAQLSLDDVDAAIDSYRKAISINPHAVKPYCNLGNALNRTGHHDEALQVFAKAIALNPEDGLLHYNLANTLHAHGQLNEAAVSYRAALRINPLYADAQRNLGVVYKNQGRTDDAMACFRKAIEINPNYAAAHWNLGLTLQDTGNQEDALSHLQTAYAIDPRAEYEYRLHSLRGETTDSAPRDYVENLFDDFAGHFEDRLLGDLEYSIPHLLKGVLADLGLTKEPFRQMLDLGCGTGLLGVELRPVVNTLVGVDLSGNMVREAEQKGVYDELFADDLVSVLGRFQNTVDLFTAGDVFVYVGNLTATFEAVRRAALAGAVFAFSVEDYDGPDPFVLQKTARFAHSRSYIQSLATTFGFERLYVQQVPLRKDNGNWIGGALYVFRVKAA